jgi:two-component system cell cycle response regulator
MFKIVVVDDDRVTLALLEKALRGDDTQVFTAFDGLGGLTLVSREIPDLVIVDLLLPQIDGFDLCRRIKENPLLPETKVIVMSAVYKGLYFKHDISKSGADAFVAKPINIQELKAKVEGFLKGRGNRSPRQG